MDWHPLPSLAGGGLGGGGGGGEDGIFIVLERSVPPDLVGVAQLVANVWLSVWNRLNSLLFFKK